MKTPQKKKIEKLEEMYKHVCSNLKKGQVNNYREWYDKKSKLESELQSLQGEQEQSERERVLTPVGLACLTLAELYDITMDDVQTAIVNYIDGEQPQPEVKESQSAEEKIISKLVWDKLKYTQCHVDGLATSIIEIKEVWELISEIESIIKVKQDTIDLNVKTNMDLVKTIQKMISKDKSKLEKALEWYANKTNREVIEFDDYDLHVCKVAQQYYREQMRNELISFCEYEEYPHNPRNHATDMLIKQIVDTYLTDKQNEK